MFATVMHDETDQGIPPGLDDLEPGPVLGALLSAIDVDRVSGYDRIVVLRAHQRMMSHHQARVWAAMGSIADAYDPDRQRRPDDIEMAATEVRAALTMTRRAGDGVEVDQPQIARTITTVTTRVIAVSGAPSLA